MLDKIFIKSPAEIKIIAEAGRKLSRVKNALWEKVQVGINAEEVDLLADQLITKEGGKPSFKMVAGYRWPTCVNVNAGLVHGIPKKEVVFQKGDVVSVDVGLYFQGFHADTSFTKGLEVSAETSRFLEYGQKALKKAITEVKPGKRIYDVSWAIEKTIKRGGYQPIQALVGHGVGRELHEGPAIPCFTRGKAKNSPEILPGMVLAIEVMYAQGSPDVTVLEDGWTIATRDGKISALYEETVAVTPSGPLVLTEGL